MFPTSCQRSTQVWKNDSPLAICTPSMFFIWLVAIKIAAPAVNPITTVCETKLTKDPKRAKPNAS